MTGADKFDVAIKEFGVNAACEYFGVDKGTKLWHIFDNLREKDKIEAGSFCGGIDQCMRALATICEFCPDYKKKGIL